MALSPNKTNEPKTAELPGILHGINFSGWPLPFPPKRPAPLHDESGASSYSPLIVPFGIICATAMR
ncbi:MAG: hypothetical protein MPK36_09800, partial [Gammaproteobacteria bacterium]|nr:hypothetical protein [Gammaproteobacteria bacterium]